MWLVPSSQVFFGLLIFPLGMMIQVMLLGRLHHRNLVNLVGYCAERGQRMLIYEFMSNGSLAGWLYGNAYFHVLNLRNFWLWFFPFWGYCGESCLVRCLLFPSTIQPSGIIFLKSYYVDVISQDRFESNSVLKQSLGLVPLELARNLLCRAGSSV